MFHFATDFTIVITLLNIVVYYLRKHQEEGYDKRSHQLCRRFSLAEIKSATHNFDEALVVGKGGFGKVYKGTIDRRACTTTTTTTTVAIKRLDIGSKQGAPEFWTEIEMLSRFKHSHLVSLIGYCDDYQEMIIVYEYMPTGSLRDHLHSKIGGGSHDANLFLSWVQRLKICIGAARGLDYLHTGTSIQERIIHRDVKSSNILLDENWAAKISDFGLSKVGPANQDCTHVSTHVKGTFGYLDPDYYLTRRVTRKSDVYALGVVLLEVLCGRPALDFELEEEQHSLARWGKKCIKEGKLDEIIDPSLRGQILATCLKEFGQLASQCLHNQPKKRPSMAEVVVKLEFALSLQEITDVSVLGEQITDHGDYDNQDNVEYSPEHAVNNGADGDEHQKEQNDRDAGLGGASGIKHQRVSAQRARFRRKMQSIFSVKTPLVLDLEYSDFHLKQTKRFSFHEIQVATDNFRKGNILGRGGGGFGKVYKGYLVDGFPVAVKRITEERSQAGEMQFLKEVEEIGLTLHRNLLRLLGYCTTPTERLLVYPYMANGSVVSRLRERPTWHSVLDWRTRKKIALGAARGLASLHEDYVIHGNIKAASIFLNQFSEIVIGNFRLSQRRYQDHVAHRTNLVLRGKRVYLAPEYLSNGKYSVETDVFGYGVMLLELITGQRACDLPEIANDDSKAMLNWIKQLVVEGELRLLVDYDLLGNYVHEEVEQLTQVALLCTHDSPVKRPAMSEVVRMLKGGTDDGLADRDVGIVESQL